MMEDSINKLPSLQDENEKKHKEMIEMRKQKEITDMA